MAGTAPLRVSGASGHSTHASQPGFSVVAARTGGTGHATSISSCVTSIWLGCAWANSPTSCVTTASATGAGAEAANATSTLAAVAPDEDTVHEHAAVMPAALVTMRESASPGA